MKKIGYKEPASYFPKPLKNSKNTKKTKPAKEKKTTKK